MALITLKNITAIQAVLDCGSFRAAAQQLGLAQSVVSGHVKNFEDWFDYALFQPGHRAAVLTLEGEEVMRCAQVLLKHHADLTAFAHSWGTHSPPFPSHDSRNITLKQIETFFWLIKLGSIVRAANKLNITQAAASRRLQELTARCKKNLFLDPRHKVELTEYGQHMRMLSEKLLTSFAKLEAHRSTSNAIVTVLHIGITELVALTWFPDFVRRLKATYPQIDLHPEVDISTSLQERLLAGRLDLAILPEPALDNAMEAVELGYTTFSWFCAPGTFGSRKRISLYSLAAKPLLVQGPESGITTIAKQLFSSAGLAPRQIFGSNSLVALAGLIESGIGVSCLPKSLFRDLVAQNRLQTIQSTTPPRANYYAAFVKQHRSAISYAVAEIAKESCRF